MSVNDTLAPQEFVGGDDLKKILRAVERIEQIKNRPLRVWEMRMAAASTMKHLEKITDTIIVPDFTPVDFEWGTNARVLSTPSTKCL